MILLSKKLLILGASILQIPAICKAKDLGYEVLVADFDPLAKGFEYTNKRYVVSTNDLEEILKIAKKERIDGIMTLASDIPMKTVAYVAEKLNLVSVSMDTAMKTTDKYLMRETLSNDKIPIPKYFKVDSLPRFLEVIELMDAKYIVKPTDNSGSRGIYLVDCERDISKLKKIYRDCLKHSRSGSLLVEEYMEGPEVSVETLTIKNKTIIVAITDKLTTGSPNFVEMGHSQPTLLSENKIKDIKKITVDAVKSVGIENGPSHTEIILTASGPKIVEIGARLGGDNITTHLVPLSTGINLVEACIKIALNDYYDIPKEKKQASAIRYFSSNKGEISAIKNIETALALSGVEQIYFTKSVGDKIEDIEDSTNRIGFVIAKAENVKRAINICEQVMELINIEIKLGS